MSSSAESDGARDRRPMTDPAVNSNKKRKVQRACDLCRRKKVHPAYFDSSDVSIVHLLILLNIGSLRCCAIVD